MEIAGFDVSFTNASLWMVLACVATLLFLSVGGRKLAVVPGRWQSMAEMMVGWIQGTLRDSAGEEGLKYFPSIFTLFLFILFCNLLGMVPFSFTRPSKKVVLWPMPKALNITA